MTKHFNKPSQKNKRRSLRQSQTLCEELAWKYLRNRQLLGYKFRRQYSIDRYIIDFYCPELKLAVEIDGASHNSVKQKQKDLVRENYLKEFNVEFIRIKDEELLGNSEKAFLKIEEAVKRLEKKME